MVDRMELDYHPDSGSGSHEDALKDANAPQESRGDVGETTFDPNDAPSDDRQRYVELRKRHHEHWDQRGGEQLQTDIAYDMRLVCNQLELTDAQQERVGALLDDYLQGGVPYEHTVVGVVTYVLNEDGRWIQREASTEDGVLIGDPLHGRWADILNAFDMSREDINRITAKIQDDEGDE